MLGYTILQDREGGILVAGSSLLSFDGDQWRKTPVDGAYSVLGLDFGPDGKLWAAASNDLGWFEKNIAGEWEFHSLRSKLDFDLLAGGSVWYVFADGAGVTFVTMDKVLRWDGVSFKVWAKPGAPRRLFSSRAAGVVFMHHPGEGLFTVDADGPHLLIPAESLTRDGILWVGHREDHWLFATTEGFYRWKEGRREAVGSELAAYLSEYRLTQCTELPSGRIAVGTVRGGLLIVDDDGRIEQIIDEQVGLPSDYVSAPHVDGDGGLWATAGSHIVRIHLRSSSEAFLHGSGPYRQGYASLAKSGGKIYAATRTGVLVLEQGGEELRNIETLSLPFGQLRETDFGLVGAGYRGVVAWDDASRTSRHLLRAQSDAIYLTPMRRDPERLVVSLGLNLVELSREGDSREIVTGLPGIAKAIAEDATGRLWIGTHGRGLWVATPNAGDEAVKATSAAEAGLPVLGGNIVTRAARDGTILVWANGGAWVRPAGGTEFSRVHGYPERDTAAVSEVAPDGATFWVALAETEKRAQVVGRVALRNGRAEWTPHAVDSLDAAGQVQCLLADTDAAGRTILWLGGTRSVLRHEIRGALQVPRPPVPVLRVFARGEGGVARAPASEMISYGAGAIEAEFAVPHFGRRAALRIESRIEGLEENWTTADTSSRRELPALRDGSYAVRVRAVSEIGEAGPEAVFRFRVLPPWWRSGWFIATVVILTVPLSLGVHRMRVRLLQARNAALEEKVRVRTRELEIASAAKTEFVANMSHDIRNPLNGIVGLALALEQTRLDERQREYVATLRECSTYLSTLVDDVLDFASIEAGRIELRPAPFSPLELLRSVAETLRANAAQRGAVLAIADAPDVPGLLNGDAGRIQQVLVNFVANAIKYAGGGIELGVTLPTDAPGEVEFFVRDFGPGLAPEQQGKLFVKFSRVHQADGTDVPGTGLGLAACRLVADLMGGSVGVQSRLGAGSRFFLRLPLAAAIAPEPVVSAQPQGGTALVVEDADYNAWAAAAVLAKLGLTCERARTGEEALRLFAERPFTIVLLDRNLPDMDGTEVARRIRAMEQERAPALLLAVTAYCTAEDRALCLASGMDEFVGKPLTPHKLRNVLRAASGRLLATASFEAVADDKEPQSEHGLLGYLTAGTDGSLAAHAERFSQSLREAEAQIDQAARSRDFQRLREAAHRVLGQARIVGGAALAEAAARLEDFARVGDAAACEEALLRVHAECQDIMAAVGRLLPATSVR